MGILYKNVVSDFTGMTASFCMFPFTLPALSGAISSVNENQGFNDLAPTAMHAQHKRRPIVWYEIPSITPTTQEPSIKENFNTFAPEDVNEIPVVIDYESTYQKVLEHLHIREGCRNNVYLDSKKLPTVGVGHLIRPEDNLKLGEYISDERIKSFLECDAQGAFQAAQEQIYTIEQNNPAFESTTEFLVAMTSVNFQLGINWTDKFYTTWPAICRGDYDRAIENLRQSKWSKETPVRVSDFIEALENLKQCEKNQKLDLTLEL